MKITFVYIVVFLYALFLMSCSPMNSDVTAVPPQTVAPTDLPPTDSNVCTDNELTKLESDIKNSLAVYNTDADFSLKVVSADNRIFEFNRGTATQNTVYESASSSKWMAATIILNRAPGVAEAS